MKTAERMRRIKRAVRSLFTDARGLRAYRIALLTKEGRELGGWCEESAVREVERILCPPAARKLARRKR